MNRTVCAIFDTAVQAYGQPIFVVAPGQAIRSFVDEVNKIAPDNQLNTHPEDFELYELCTFDDNTGLFSQTAPRLLTRGQDVKTS